MAEYPLVTGHAAWVALATPPPGIAFAREEGRLDPAEYTALVRASGLVRPVDDAARMAAMVAGSNLIVTARDATGRLLGAARSFTDFAYGCYLSDLCVDPAGQGQGIGRALIAETKRILGPGCMLLLLSAPDPMTWYPKLGMERVANGFIIRRDG
ncbi:GNAT family N-acetyltransferase [Belnapia rosea]|uniref:Acetyltransferase (GNAT) domain-containing protein n=1 Tax=Belnapia rosea TaxID=938405 RepID=A0A1G6LUZ8_9PROT|nr:GNAT family N-acetyltransferase [Belnapia rosea]SDB46088.1 Acetyltransferase (GNAT) domain-containing protein [Belnapia rosea]SDC46575.1 Acetyltransferase (GNAT) domain-containing protein [Belnapia rosea]